MRNVNSASSCAENVCECMVGCLFYGSNTRHLTFTREVYVFQFFGLEVVQNGVKSAELLGLMLLVTGLLGSKKVVKCPNT